MKRNDKMATISAILLAAGVGGAFVYLKNKKYKTLHVYPNVDLDRYLGEWYEIARIPNRYEKSCYNTRANYSLNEDGTIKVVNICNKAIDGGALKVAKGKVFVIDKKTNAKFKVHFAWPFKGDYWILDVGKDYEYALVGNPSRENLWILSRSAKINGNSLRKLKSIAIREGFDVDRLVYTEHVEESRPTLKEETVLS